MRKKIQDDAAIRPDGDTRRAKWYALARRYCKIIADRQRKKERCKKCFAMRFCRRDKRNYPRVGCGGCVEMDSFFEEAEALVKGEETNQHFTILG